MSINKLHKYILSPRTKLIIFPRKNKCSYVTVIVGVNQDLDSFTSKCSNLGGTDPNEDERDRGAKSRHCFFSFLSERRIGIGV